MHSVSDQVFFILILVTFPWVKAGGDSELLDKYLFKVFDTNFKSVICFFILSKICLGERKGIFILAVIRLQSGNNFSLTLSSKPSSYPSLLPSNESPLTDNHTVCFFLTN